MSCYKNIPFNLFLICLLSLFLVSLVKSEGNLCSKVQEHFLLKGFDISFPDNPAEGSLSRLCSSSSNCCTDEVLDRLSNFTVEDYKSKVEHLTNSVKSTLSKKHKKFDKFFIQLITNAYTRLNSMFIDTYGPKYSVNADVFLKLFEDLKDYYRGTVLDVGEIFESFFTEVMQKVFALMHPEFVFSDEYKQCIADNMEAIQPFATTPEVLAQQFKRAFVAARTFVRGLQAGRKFTAGVGKFRASQRCIDELVAMSHCTGCQGGAVVKPCPHLCMGVMRGCLSDYRHFGDVWESYVDGLRQLLNRLDGPFNIEAVLEPFEVKLSEAVMMVQENQVEIDEAVFRECGLPKSRNTTGLSQFGGLGGADSSILDPSYLESYPAPESRSKRSAKHSKSRQSHNKRRKGRRSRRGRRNRGAKGAGIRITHELLRPNIEETRYRYNKGDDDIARERHASTKTALGTNLAALVAQMKRTLEAYEHHWRELPRQVCDGVAEPSDTCWNGETVTKTTAVDKDEQEKIETKIASDHVTQPHIVSHQRELRKVVAQLKLGYKGVDPHKPPSDDEGDLYSADGSGQFDFGKEMDDLKPETEVHINVDIGNKIEVTEEQRTTEKPKICTDCGGNAPSLSSNLLLIGCSLLLAFIT